MFWAYYDAKSLTTYYNENTMTTTEFANKISPRVGKTLTASDISKVRDQSELKKMLSVNAIRIE